MNEKLIARIQSIAKEKGHCFVAIDGRCASGKSTLGAELAQELNCPLFHLDDFFLRVEQRTPQRFKEPGGNVDRERFLEEILIPLSQKKDIAYHTFDCSVFELSDGVTTIPYAPIVIAEGSYSCHPAMRDYYDYRIFMTVNETEQMERIVKRNPGKAEMFRTRWIPFEESYFQTLDIGSVFDEIIDTGKNDRRRDCMEFPEKMKNFGFGLMRLPRVEGEGDVIDIEQYKKMVDLYLEAGMNYFDTAYVYAGSEEATKKALVERKPRESYFLTSKLNVVNGCHDAESAKQEFFTSLERTGAEYFDFYLLHALKKDNYKRFEEWGIYDFVEEQKAKGLIKHLGFSFHDGPELLDEILSDHPEFEFVQLQLNYADWENPAVQSRACYEVARKHNKPIVVMEPIKGGTLANPPKEVMDLFHSVDPNASAASWAVRFVASLEGVMVVLSGMSNIPQMEDNLSYMKDFKPMSEEEQEVIRKAMKILAEIPQIPCTSCRYCVADCPMQIAIPDVFRAMNKVLVFGNKEQGARDFKMATNNKGLPSACIKCGMCEASCPQHIEIREWLEKAAEEFE